MSDLSPVDEVETAADLARELKRLTRRSPVKVAGLAKRLGVSQSTLYAYLAGTTVPSSAALDELLTALGVPAEEHRRLATARDALHRPRGVVRRERPLPAELPADPAGFTGRAVELAVLDGARAGGPPIAVIAGPAGVGKTALAVRWGHRADFPDGCLYADLRGYSAGEPRDPGEVLAGFLRSLGVDDIPEQTHERAARFRSALARRRLLLVLDNAVDVDQVRPLLPGGPPCFALVTSRTDLAGLQVDPGAHRVDLRPLGTSAGVALLRAQIGPRVDRSADAAQRLAERCGGLPLALRIVAARARGGSSLDDLLADLGPGLDGFDVGDPGTAVRTVFSWSLRHLADSAVTDFRLLGAQPGHDIGLPAAAALFGVDEAEAGRRLGVLVRAHLVQRASERFGMHDLVRAYAAEREPAGLDDALIRLADHYASAAAAAMAALHPGEGGGPAPMPMPAARAWVDAEWDTLVALVAVTARRGWSAQARRLADPVQRHLDQAGRHTDALIVLGHVHDAARAEGDREAEGAALYHLGVAYLRLGRHREAMAHHKRALDVCRLAGDRNGEAGALNNLGNLYERLGRYAEAMEHYRAALALADTVELRKGRACLLTNLTVVHTRLGDHAEALSLGEEALTIFTELADPGGTARTLSNLADIHRAAGRPDTAIPLYRRALETARQIDARGIETEVLNNLAATHLSTGDTALAVLTHRTALAVARETGDRYEEARALEGIGTAAADPTPLREALAIYTHLDLPEATRLRTALAESPSGRA